MGQQRKRQERSRATYYQEDEVARLIVNLAQWNGDGASVRGCAGHLGPHRSRVLPKLDAGRYRGRRCGTREARARAHAGPSWPRRSSPSTYRACRYSSRRRLLGISRDTYHRRLVEAHPRFMEEYGEEGRNQVRQSNERAAHVRGPDFIETPPASRGPRRLVKRGAKNV
jgi:hypothetical protein